MESNLNVVRSAARVVALEGLSDADLLAGTRRLVGRSNELLAELLAHLGEVEARGIHRTRACSSLYAYCVYELRLSEDEAYRRVAAARLVRRFPALRCALASGELHLTGLLLLGPHLTEANLVEVLLRAKHRTKREIARLVRILDPLPAVAARIEPLGPAPARVLSGEPSWKEFVRGMSPVRELAPGERPRDWSDGANDANEPAVAATSRQMSSTATSQQMSSTATPPQSEPLPPAPFTPGPPAPEPQRCEPLRPERYKIQFTATTEYVQLVEEAKALLSHAVPNVSLEEIQLRAVRALVVELKRKKYATLEASRRADAAPRGAALQPTVASHDVSVAAPGALAAPGAGAWQGPLATPGSVAATGPLAATGPSVPRSFAETNGRQRASRPVGQERPLPRQRGRHVPAAVRRAVFERDGNRCSYVDAGGRRCLETHFLEFHHVEPFAVGGENTASNLTLRCRAHNALAAEQDFGRKLIEDKLALAGGQHPERAGP